MIYFIHSPHNTGRTNKVKNTEGAVKIGFSESFEGIQKRHAALQAGNPYELSLLAVGPGGYVEEKAIHAKFQRHNIRGEWFRYVPELQKLVDRARAVDWHDEAITWYKDGRNAPRERHK